MLSGKNSIFPIRPALRAIFPLISLSVFSLAFSIYTQKQGKPRINLGFAMRALPPSDQLHLQIERAWYLLTVLLRIGRPARPLELDPDPELVESLCQIHGSPLVLTDNGLVTVSGSALGCFFQFWSNLSSSPAFSAGARVFENGRRRDQVVVSYARKRKMRGHVMPVSTKRRLLIGCERDVEELEKDESKLIQPVGTCIAEKLEREDAGNLNALHNIPLQKLQNTDLASNHHAEYPLKIQDERVDNCISLKISIKRGALEHNLPNETNVNDAAKPSKSQIEQKRLPNLKAFIIEEEEGSGGYGTVYKAKRKSDGEIFAVKCPHPNANSHHVKNEMKMLERFGGRNFIIKYEGSFKSGNSECFLLEHVEHDRPETLKKEISVLELRWYGYCLFKALASLHKQGIAHRDVKPGNFLFSRKLNKGYLIDFNLASDLHQRFLRNATRTDPARTSATMSNANNTKEKQNQILKRKRSTEKQLEAATRQERSNYSQKTADGSAMTSIKDLSTRTSRERQTELMMYSKKKADVSGVTSLKDLTSTRTSQERRKQPIMYQGLRKELVHFLKDTTNGSPNKERVGPSPQRKRVTAPPIKSDRRLVIFTPMPLYCGGAAIAGSGVHKSKGEGKHRKEGPCAGTKGFRAPEVLFKSFHQSCKIDIWSAGVTLLYMIIGKAPFGGDPEQNIKEIAKLRGSEDLWEVAKLHNCECSFPKELFDVQYVQSRNLRDWCEINSRRPEFIQAIPDSLFDLIDKCLTVNPRCRVSAEEALAHGFFLHCHESLRKQRLLRKSSLPGSTQVVS